jgi:prepilin-type N-terminal cleavage/methylation domain-containing protein
MIRRNRKGFTLVEMLVVLTIIVIVSVIIIPFISKNNDKDIVPRGARYLQMALIQAKARAQAERRPCGVRLLPTYVTNPAINAYPSGTITIAWSGQMEYIQDSGDFTDGAAAGPVNLAGPPPADRTVNLAGLSTTRPLTADVLPGDLVEFFDNSQSFAITKVINGPPGSGTGQLVLGRPVGYPIQAPLTFSNYRVIRRPRPIPGEKPMELPAGVIVDLTLPWSVTNNPTPGPNPPVLTANDRDQGNTIWMGGLSTPFLTAPVDIVFSPSGQVVGSAAANDIIYLWLHPFGEPNNWALKNPGSSLGDAGNQALVVIYARNGMITSCPVEQGVTGAAQDPYSFAKAARAQNVGGL